MNLFEVSDVALVTPFTDTGNDIYSKLSGQIDCLISQRVDAIIVCKTIGIGCGTLVRSE